MGRVGRNTTAREGRAQQWKALRGILVRAGVGGNWGHGIARDKFRQQTFFRVDFSFILVHLRSYSVLGDLREKSEPKQNWRRLYVCGSVAFDRFRKRFRTHRIFSFTSWAPCRPLPLFHARPQLSKHKESSALRNRCRSSARNRRHAVVGCVQKPF